jgi:hypothetical protein
MNPVQNHVASCKWRVPQQHSVPDLVVIGICSLIPSGTLIPAQARERFGDESSTNRYRIPSPPQK